MKIMNTLTKIAVVLGGVFLTAIFLALPIMLLWNWLMPMLFGLMKLNFWQSLGVVLLTGLLFRMNQSNDK